MQQLAAVLWGIGFILTAIALPVMVWQAVIGVAGLLPGRRKNRSGGWATRRYRFAVVVCARNEETVIGRLLDSLMAQRYPRDRFDLFVAADNCDDRTVAEARSHGATAYERRDRRRVGKGFALRWVLERIEKEHPGRYDAVAVFDADNVATPDFLARMNDALCAGADVAKGSRFASNPHDSWVSGSYAIYWRSMMRFFHKARARCGLSCFVDGTGFAFRTALIRDEGWNTRTIVEDCEFSMQQICRGRVIVPVEEAVYYDEQPTTFALSVRQRFRWTVGCVQCLKACFPDALRALRPGSGVSLLEALDVLMYLLLFPAVAVGLAAGAVSFIAALFSPVSYVAANLAAFLSPLLSWAGLSLGGLLVLALDRQPLKAYLPAVLMFPVFVYSMSLMALVAVFRPKVTWKPIAHTGSLVRLPAAGSPD